MLDRPTLVRPPPPDSTKAPIENVLEVTKLDVLGPDLFTNTRQPWHPPGARGIFGGAVIAQCLAAGQKTVPANFFPHSCHCYFLLAGSDEIPILFHVERVRDGRSFCTRTVQARQRGRCIFTVTMSFVKTGSGGARQVSHQAEFPTEEAPPTDQEIAEEESRMGGIMSGGPFQNWRVNIVGKDGRQATISADSQRNGQRPETLKTRMWVRARGKISEEGGHEAHLNALAYVSDSYFIATASRVHGLWKWPFRPDEVQSLPEKLRAQVKRQVEFEGTKWDVGELTRRERLGMTVSLDHSIYFHHPDKVRADDWMLCEMESPWAGDGRGVVMQRIFSRDGTLLATCVQEGLVRLKQDGKDQPNEAGKAKAKI